MCIYISRLLITSFPCVCVCGSLYTYICTLRFNLIKKEKKEKRWKIGSILQQFKNVFIRQRHVVNILYLIIYIKQRHKSLVDHKRLKIMIYSADENHIIIDFPLTLPTNLSSHTHVLRRIIVWIFPPKLHPFEEKNIIFYVNIINPQLITFSRINFNIISTNRNTFDLNGNTISILSARRSQNNTYLYTITHTLV